MILGEIRKIFDPASDEADRAISRHDWRVGDAGRITIGTILVDNVSANAEDLKILEDIHGV